MTTIKKIFNKLHEADKPKINLSLANDLSIAADVIEGIDSGLQFAAEMLEERFDAFEKAEKDYENAKEDTLEAKNDATRELSDAYKILEKAEKLANELGVDPDDIPDYSYAKDKVI